MKKKLAHFSILKKKLEIDNSLNGTLHVAPIV